MKQTPIDWFINELKKERIIRDDLKTTIALLTNKANAMFEERIKDAYGDGLNLWMNMCNPDEYYQKNYKEDK